MAASTIPAAIEIALNTILAPSNVVLILAAVIFGLALGILPGMNGVIVIALLIPLTFTMEPIVAIMVLVAANGGVSQGGSITAILINTPGMAPNAATILDGYPMAKKGEAKRAIMASLTASAAGAILGILVLALTIPLMTEIVLAFGYPETFWLGVWGVSVVAVVVRGSVVKGLISAAIGGVFAAHGINFLTSTYRWTYGLPMMQDGFKFIPIIVGLFAVSEMINLISKGERIAKTDVITATGNRWEGIKDVYTHKWVWFRSSVIGVIIGTIPGVGGTVANFVAYFQAAQTSGDDSFGTGDVRGVIASEASNDAKEGGAYLPTLALGIPGSASMAVLIGAFVVQGVTPGPTMVQDHLDLIFIVILAALLSNVLSSVFGAVAVNQLSKITRIDIEIIAPIIIAWAFFGGFAVTNNIFDLAFVWIGGVLGLLMMKINMSRVPLVLALVLGPIVERTYWQSLQVSDTGSGIFFQSPLSKLLVVITVLTLLWPIVKPAFVTYVYNPLEAKR
jgi:putative tricarboxylic transport membrane protein